MTLEHHSLGEYGREINRNDLRAIADESILGPLKRRNIGIFCIVGVSELNALGELDVHSGVALACPKLSGELNAVTKGNRGRTVVAARTDLVREGVIARFCIRSLHNHVSVCRIRARNACLICVRGGVLIVRGHQIIHVKRRSVNINIGISGKALCEGVCVILVDKALNGDINRSIRGNARALNAYSELVLVCLCNLIRRLVLVSVVGNAEYALISDCLGVINTYKVVYRSASRAARGDVSCEYRV